jgi:hypothetical protein
MKTAAQLFYLAVFGLLAAPTAANTEKAAQVIAPEDNACAVRLSPSSPRTKKSQLTNVCQINPHSVVDDACASYSTLENINHELGPAIQDITTSTDFFSYYRLNLYNKQCPFWEDNDSLCGNRACAVVTIDDEKDIPLIWRAEELSKLEGPRAKHPPRSKQTADRVAPLEGQLGEDTSESCVVEYDDECDDRNYCVPDDEDASGKGDYVSLVENPERFTGYIGKSANMVWDAIYRENCFSRASFSERSGFGSSLINSNQLPAANDLRFIMQGGLKHDPKIGHAPSAETGYENNEECLEKRVFYRVVSGMHASISTHICWQSLNQTTGEWGPNLQCYKDRLHGHPDRIANLYFNYALVTRAIAKLQPYMKDYTFCIGDPAQDALTKKKVLDITAIAASRPQIFDESLMFVNGEGPSLKEDFRQRFRNVSRVMDCVACDKCRLWGKLQTNGYGTALKVLFDIDNPHGGEMAERPPPLKRTELVALFNTLARISSSLSAVEKFREMVELEESAHEELHGKHYHRDERGNRQAVDGKLSEDDLAELEDPETSKSEGSADVEDEEEEAIHIPDEEESYMEFLKEQRKVRDPATESLREAVTQETKLVARVVLHIFRQWLGLPKLM